MKTITLQTSLGSGIDPILDGCRRLTIDSTSFAAGGFGEVYHCRNVDGRTVAPLVVKIFYPGSNRCLKTVTRLQERLKEEHLKRVQKGSSLIGEYPALAGIPLLSFEGVLEGKTVLGCVARDLIADGLEELQAVENDSDAYTRFQQIPLVSKYEMANQFVRALDFLNREASFLHCDLKTGAFFFSAKPVRCVLIDYDGGAVLRHPKDEPSTPGTPEGWVAPEVRSQMVSANPLGFVKVSLASERWSAACAVHFLIFGCSHDFFFNELSNRSMRAYQQQFRWPEVTASFPYLKPGILAAHSVHHRCLKQLLPIDLQRYLSFTFTQGYFDPGQRITCAQWQMALETTQQPAIHAFDTDTLLVTEKQPILLSWEVTGAASLYLQGVGYVTGMNSRQVTVTKPTTFELVLTTKQGQKITKKLQVDVDTRPPFIRTLRLNPAHLTDKRTVRLDWDIERGARIMVRPGIGDVTGRTFIEVSPRQDTTYHLYAYSGLDVMASRTVSLTVSKQAPKIDLFKASDLIVEHGTRVDLSWQVEEAESVDIGPHIGHVPLKGTHSLTVDKNCKLTLTATSYFGVKITSNAYIYVVKRTALNPNPTQRGHLTQPVFAATPRIPLTSPIRRSMFDQSGKAKYWKKRFAKEVRSGL